MSKTNRRDYGAGAIYQRSSDGLFIGAYSHGYTATGARKRHTVSAKTEAAVKRKLRDKIREIEAGEATSGRTTVKAWADEYLAMRVRDMSPKGYNAMASPLNLWVIPTIGHRRLADLTPGDIRQVAEVQRAAGRKAADTHRVLKTMLNAAILEGHQVPPRVLKVKAPTVPKSDRLGMTINEGIGCLKVASEIPHGTRWLVTLVYGMRQGECLGLTWDAIDFDAGELAIEWQLQAFPYIDRSNKALGFRVPDDMEARHLVDAWHLKRPKSKQGYRIAPLLPAVQTGLEAWREIAPPNPWGLVWPTTTGRPANGKHDLNEWHAVQGTAGVGHPAGRPYHVHECRNFAATVLGEAGVDPFVIRSLLGHADAATSEGYRNVPRGPLRDALQRVGERLQLG